MNDYQDFTKFSQIGAEGFMKAVGDWNKGIQAIAAETTDYYKRAFEDGTSTFQQLASAKSISEAAQIQSDLLRSRGEVFVSRAKATTDYLGKLAANGAKSAQDNFAKVYNKTA